MVLPNSAKEMADHLEKAFPNENVIYRTEDDEYNENNDHKEKRKKVKQLSKNEKYELQLGYLSSDLSEKYDKKENLFVQNGMSLKNLQRKRKNMIKHGIKNLNSIRKEKIKKKKLTCLVCLSMRKFV